MEDDDEMPEPRVLEAPATMWLNYGDIERDDTHANLAHGGVVTWCEDAQFAADVKYVRADVADDLVRRCMPYIVAYPSDQHSKLLQDDIAVALAKWGK